MNDTKHFAIGIVVGAVIVVAVAWIPVTRMKAGLDEMQTELQRAEEKAVAAQQQANQWHELSVQLNNQSLSGACATQASSLLQPSRAMAPANEVAEAAAVALWNQIHPGWGTALKTVMDQAKAQGGAQ